MAIVCVKEINMTIWIDEDENGNIAVDTIETQDIEFYLRKEGYKPNDLIRIIPKETYEEV